MRTTIVTVPAPTPPIATIVPVGDFLLASGVEVVPCPEVPGGRLSPPPVLTNVARNSVVQFPAPWERTHVIRNVPRPNSPRAFSGASLLNVPSAARSAANSETLLCSALKLTLVAALVTATRYW